MLGKINAFIAREFKHFKNSFNRHKADSASMSDKADMIRGKQNGAHISAAYASIALNAPSLASFAAY